MLTYSDECLDQQMDADRVCAEFSEESGGR
jgi:hypothetical protein